MSDDIWRSGRDRDKGNEEGEGKDEFGEVLFADDDPTSSIPATEEESLSFGSDDSGSLPHWTEPPTGQVPRLGGEVPTGEVPATEVDVWSTYSDTAYSDTEGPMWSDEVEEEVGEVEAPGERTGEHFFDLPDEIPTGRPPARISIGTDPTGDQARARPARSEGGRRGGGRPSDRPGPRAPARPGRPAASGTSARNMPAAVAAGLILAAVFLAAIMWRPAAVVAFVVLVIGLAAVEFYAKVTEKGYRPATFAGLLACVSMPLAAYWVGNMALPLVITFAFLAAAIGFVGADGIESGPLPNMAVTMLGVVWLGLMGAYAVLIVSYSAIGGPFVNVGTDTLFLVVIGVVANDVGALFVGSGIGKTTLREWISPSKSVEGLIGGTVFTFLAVILVGIQSDTWNDLSEWLLLALVISVMAPFGDLAESMFKRNLNVKDFGTLVPGHGGVLDRFDGFLFVLPAVYYLMVVLQPWAS